MLTELGHLEPTRYNTEGMEHPELSTTICSEDHLGPEMVWKHDAERCGYLKGVTQQTPDTGKKELQHAQHMHAPQIRGFNAKLMVLTFRRNCVSTDSK